MMRSISIQYRACAAPFTSRRQLKSPAIIKVRFPVSQTFCSQIKGLSGALRGELWQISSHFDFLQCSTKTPWRVFCPLPAFCSRRISPSYPFVQIYASRSEFAEMHAQKPEKRAGF
ncbi:hypothetical protein J2X56_004588 [Herbaspirillum sp. 1173]|uniref:hypothetical protein n=2 Tax=unclassified Herbaspirillum TaxID=2624150 RepID=UPI001956D105|nr:hypothetical protein [Herbaspirillum sp. 1130]MBP1317495.1 hypothetical protein [Herbaspirillum sp. 1130]MDR6742557.1 hypothetical protein [Herbaspirillum sp. 1173]